MSVFLCWIPRFWALWLHLLHWVKISLCSVSDLCKKRSITLALRFFDGKNKVFKTGRQKIFVCWKYLGCLSNNEQTGCRFLLSSQPGFLFADEAILEISSWLLSFWKVTVVFIADNWRPFYKFRHLLRDEKMLSLQVTKTKEICLHICFRWTFHSPVLFVDEIVKCQLCFGENNIILPFQIQNFPVFLLRLSRVSLE